MNKNNKKINSGNDRQTSLFDGNEILHITVPECEDGEAGEDDDDYGLEDEIYDGSYPEGDASGEFDKVIDSNSYTVGEAEEEAGQNDAVAEENGGKAENGKCGGCVPSVLNDDSDTDKMASILEEDVTSEITVDTEDGDDGDDGLLLPEIEKRSDNKRAGKTAVDKKALPTFAEIKNNAEMAEFETPYIYRNKSGEHIRYRLCLPNNKKPGKKRVIKNVLSYVATALMAVILAFLIREFVFVIATVDGPSMETTLYTNERVFVNRITYRFNEIERGDIIVCRFPSPAYPKRYVKRVIALGGETISIKDSVVYINGKALPEDYITIPALRDMEEQYVPEGSVFVIGDNRNNSSDSRKSSIGAVPEELVIGKVECILYPFKEMAMLDNVEYPDFEAFADDVPGESAQ